MSSPLLRRQFLWVRNSGWESCLLLAALRVVAVDGGSHCVFWEACCHCNVCVESDSVIPLTVAHQSPLSTEFSRWKYWNGLHFPPQGIFPTQRSNLSLSHRKQRLYHLSHQGSTDPLYAISIFFHPLVLEELLFKFHLPFLPCFLKPKCWSPHLHVHVCSNLTWSHIPCEQGESTLQIQVLLPIICLQTKTEAD